MKILKTVVNAGSVIKLMLMMTLKRSLSDNWIYRGSAHRDCNINVKLSCIL